MNNWWDYPLYIASLVFGCLVTGALVGLMVLAYRFVVR